MMQWTAHSFVRPASTTQQREHLIKVARRSDVGGRGTILIAQFRARARIEQHAHGFCVAIAARNDQGGIAKLVLRVPVGACSQ